MYKVKKDKNLKGWYVKETIGISIVNPRGCLTVKGGSAELEILISLLRKHHPELFEDKDG
jgi:hypothetical protein